MKQQKMRTWDIKTREHSLESENTLKIVFRKSALHHTNKTQSPRVQWRIMGSVVCLTSECFSDCCIDLAQVVNLCPFAQNSHNDLSSGILQSITPSVNQYYLAVLLYLTTPELNGHFSDLSKSEFGFTWCFGTDNYISQKLWLLNWLKEYNRDIVHPKAMQVCTEYLAVQA